MALQGTVLAVLLSVALVLLPTAYFVSSPQAASHILYKQQLLEASTDFRDYPGAWNNLDFTGCPQEVDTLRIAGFIRKWPAWDQPGGMERHAFDLYYGLSQRGHTVHVFAAGGPGKGPEVKQLTENLTVHLIETPQEGQYSTEYTELGHVEFMKIHQDTPFHVVHTESKGLSMEKAALLHNITVVTWHGQSYDSILSLLNKVHMLRLAGQPPTKELTQQLGNKLQSIVATTDQIMSYKHHVAISHAAAEALELGHLLAPERVHIIFNGRNASVFHPDKDAGAAFREKHGIPSNAGVVFGVAGRLVEDKGHNVLAPAMQRVLARHPDVYLLAAGSGGSEAVYRGMGDRVKLLGSIADPTELARFYNALDAFLDPTLRSNGFDLTLEEAALCSTAILATKTPSITMSLLTDDEYGYTFLPTAESIANALEKAIQDGPSGLAEKGRRLHQRFAHQFDLATMLTSYERLFHCVADEAMCVCDHI